MAGARVFDEAVLHAVERVALIDGGFLDSFEFGGRHRGFRIDQQRLFVPNAAGNQMRPCAGWRASDDAVEVVGEALGLHESFCRPPSEQPTK